MSNLRFAIVGIGNIARTHAAAIRATAGAELVAATTRDAAKGQAFAAEYGIGWETDYTALLERANVDVVVLCTPHDLHLPMTVEAAKAGKHVLCEKPMARNVAECDAMITACDQAGVTLGITFQYRFEPLAQQLKAALDAGEIGKLLWASVSTIWYRSQAYYQSAAWRGTWAHEGGGVLINQASHSLDLFLWLTGMPSRVTAQMRTLNHQIEVEDAVMAHLQFPNGGIGSVQATTIAFPGYPEQVQLVGELGSVTYYRGQGRLEWHWMEPRRDRVDESPAISGASGPETANAGPHTAAYRDYVAAVREHRPPLIDGREGRHSVEVIQAIYASAQTDAPVKLPL